MNERGELRSTVELRTIDGITLLVFRGECDEKTAAANKGIVEGFINMGQKLILIDMTDLSITSRIGYIALDDCCMDMYHAGGKLVLINPKPDVREAIEKAPLSRGCVVADTVEEALLVAKGKAA